MSARTEVLIVGAGPTGLVLALWLNRFGVRARIIDQAPEPGRTSRALVIHARTLELYRQLDLAAPAVERGRRFAAVNLWVVGRHAARVELGPMGEGLSPFPYMLIYPQDEHERLLIDRLSSQGIQVDRPTKLVGLQRRGDRVSAQLEHGDGTQELCEADYVAGCDGARSFVRDALGVGYPGGTYAHLFYVADIEAVGPVSNGELHVALDDADLLVCFPLKARSHIRLVGTVRKEAQAAGERLDWNAVNEHVIRRIRLQVRQVNWFSTYHVHHRVASAFRTGRVFLLGDAAHVHSPVGGQGMNTGIGDAVNLAWKLAATLRGQADVELLDSYQDERVRFAERLVHTTDRAFAFVSSSGPIADWVRVGIVPHVLPAIFRSDSVRRFLFQTVSQIQVNYRQGKLAKGVAGRIHGGDRLPWLPDEHGSDNFASLSSPGWRVHVYGAAPHTLTNICDTCDVPLDVFPWGKLARQAGFGRDAAYLIRPDGYVGLAMAHASATDELERYLKERGLRPR